MFLFSLDKYPGMVLSLDNMSGLFLILLRNLHTISHSGCANLHIPPKVHKGFLSPHPCQPLLFFVILIMAILTDIRWYLIVVMICISLIISGVGHLFMCLSTICMSSWKKSIQMLCPFFKNWMMWFFFYVELYEFFVYFEY